MYPDITVSKRVITPAGHPSPLLVSAAWRHSWWNKSITETAGSRHAIIAWESICFHVVEKPSGIIQEPKEKKKGKEIN